MAAKVKGLTLEIDGNTEGLEKGLTKLNKPISAVKNELKDVTRLLKLDPGNTTILAQKQELLGKQISASKDKLAALQQAKKAADDEMKNGTEINQEEYRKGDYDALLKTAADNGSAPTLYTVTMQAMSTAAASALQQKADALGVHYTSKWVED